MVVYSPSCFGFPFGHAKSLAASSTNEQRERRGSLRNPGRLDRGMSRDMGGDEMTDEESVMCIDALNDENNVGHTVEQREYHCSLRNSATKH